VNILEENTKIMAEAVETYALGEDVHYAVSLTVVPGANGQAAPVLIYLVSIPGLGIGERMVAQTLQGEVVVDKDIPSMVNQMMEYLKNQRSEAAQKAMETPLPQQNGHGKPLPGLIDPRQGM
jgi:hypothetical protein